MIALLFALFVPRLVAVYLWLLTNWFTGVFETRLWPILGFLFMPYTLIWYSVVFHWYSGEWGFWQVVILVGAIVADLSSGKKATNR